MATQDDAEDVAAEASRERARRLNADIKAHGGLTGRAPRGSAPDTLDYQDDPSMI